MRKMKEMKKAAASVILAAAMVVSMTGCGGSDTKTETPETPAETTAQTPYYDLKNRLKILKLLHIKINVLICRIRANEI